MGKHLKIRVLNSEERLRRDLLKKFQDECDYYLNHGKPKNWLYNGSPEEQIAAMKQLWESYPAEDKPEWLTWEQILEYEREMCSE